MTFEEYLNDAWASHPTNSAELLRGFEESFSLINSADEVNALGNLIAHVSGEHLGEWGKGIQLLESLRQNPQVKDMSALNRFIAALSLGEDKNFSLESFSSSEKVRILSMTASALASQNEVARAGKYLEQAEEICQSLNDKKDPANRNLAIAGNNLACALEDKAFLTHAENNLMLHAAFVGRKFWELAGTWMEVERAEYRLAKVFLKADILDKAFAHAERCMEIIAENGNEALEVFFGLEAMALVEKARKNNLGYEEAVKGMKEAFEKINPDDQKWCKSTLEKIAGL